MVLQYITMTFQKMCSYYKLSGIELEWQCPCMIKLLDSKAVRLVNK